MVINRILSGVAIALLAAGCASQGGTRQPRATVEQRRMIEEQDQLRQAEERDKQARIQEEQAALRRHMQSLRQDKEPVAAQNREEQPQIVRLSETSLSERPLDDPMHSRADLNASVSKRSIYYQFDAYNVDEQYEPVLTAHAKLLMEDPALQMRVEGNCDERGSREYNLALGQRRADSVKRALSLLGVSTKQVTAVSFGSEKPKALGHNDTDWAENRRSDLMYVGIDGPQDAPQSSESAR
jgi:peptidoglycan-associated lipoprotein